MTTEGERGAGATQLGGDAAIDLVQRIADPMQTLRDRLGLVVDHLERHIAHASGPAPYPWRALQTLRHDLAAVYLETTTLAKCVDELARALGDLGDDARRRFDLAAATELGLGLATGELAAPAESAPLELLVDLAGTPAVVGSPGLLALVVAQLVGACAASARELPGSAVSVRVAQEAGDAVLLVTDNGAGAPRAAQLGALAASIIGAWGATIDATSAPGQGTAFELRFRVA